VADWFRRDSWSEEDRADFEQRLKRARSPFHKAQYLYLQAVHLRETREPELLAVALSLVERAIGEYPDHVRLAEALQLRAGCLEDGGRLDDACQAYRETFKAQRGSATTRTMAHLDFAELVARRGRMDLVDEALSTLEEFDTPTPFPVHSYRSAAVRAFLQEMLGDLAGAAESALAALEAAAMSQSPLRYHRNLGVVGQQEPDVESRLRRLAGRTSPS
jgi:tetratricopeptide (TPR) repeat protein